MKKVIKQLVLLAFLVCLAGAAFSQAPQVLLPKNNVFESVPKPAIRFKTSRNLTIVDSSNLSGWFTRPVVLGGYAASKQIVAGAGIGEQLLRYDQSSKKWKEVVGVSIVAWGMGNVAPGPQTPAFAIGPSVHVLNNLVHVGWAYDFRNNQGIFIFGMGIALNN